MGAVEPRKTDYAGSAQAPLKRVDGNLNSFCSGGPDSRTAYYLEVAASSARYRSRWGSGCEPDLTSIRMIR